MYTLEYLGIYSSEIKRGVYIAEAALEEVGLSDMIDDLNDRAAARLVDEGNWCNITNSIIDAYFEEAYSIIMSKTNDIECDYFVNGLDSHFVINGDEVSTNKEY